LGKKVGSQKSGVGILKLKFVDFTAKTVISLFFENNIIKQAQITFIAVILSKMI
jgi:hypothetical protein